MENNMEISKYYDKLSKVYDKKMRKSNEFFDIREKEILAGFVKGKNIGSAIDLGCGTGRMTRFLNELEISAAGVDISPEMIKIAKKNESGSKNKIAYIVGDIEEYAKRKGKKTDLVCFFGVVSFIKDLERLIGNISKKTNPKYLFFDFVNSKSLAPRIKFRNSKVKRNFYSLEEIENILKRNGFEIIFAEGTYFVPLPKKYIEFWPIKPVVLWKDRMLSKSKTLSNNFAYRIYVGARKI